MTKLSRNSKQIIAGGSSHHIHIDQPELVVEAIKQIGDAINNNKKLNK